MYKAVFVDCNSIATTQSLADYAMLAFQAKQARTPGIDSCHQVIYARRMAFVYTDI
jgi:hypothetical protein